MPDAWSIRELAAEETHGLRRSVSADGRTDLPTMRHELDDAPGSWHLGAVDAAGRVVAVSSYFAVPAPFRPDVGPAVRLQLMAVEPALQRRGIGGAVMAAAIGRLRASGIALLWADARDDALPFYARFGFRVVDGGDAVPAATGRPHHLIELAVAMTGVSQRRPSGRAGRRSAAPPSS